MPLSVTYYMGKYIIISSKYYRMEKVWYWVWEWNTRLITTSENLKFEILCILLYVERERKKLTASITPPFSTIFHLTRYPFTIPTPNSQLSFLSALSTLNSQQWLRLWPPLKMLLLLSLPLSTFLLKISIPYLTPMNTSRFLSFSSIFNEVVYVRIPLMI